MPFCRHITLLAHIQFVIYNNSRILLACTIAELGIPHLVTVCLVSFSKVWYFALVPVEFHSVVFSPVLKPIQIILNFVSLVGEGAINHHPLSRIL